MYYWDFLTTGNSALRTYSSYQFYIRYTATGGGTYWLGGDTDPLLFTLYCDPCRNINVNVDSSQEIMWVVGKNTLTSTTDTLVISDVLSATDSTFYGDTSTDSQEDCDALYLEAYSDSGCSVALSLSTL